MNKEIIKEKIRVFREEEFKIRQIILNELEGKRWEEGIWISDFRIKEVKDGDVWDDYSGIWLTTDEIIALYQKSLLLERSKK